MFPIQVNCPHLSIFLQAWSDDGTVSKLHLSRIWNGRFIARLFPSHLIDADTHNTDRIEACFGEYVLSGRIMKHDRVQGLFFFFKTVHEFSLTETHNASVSDGPVTGIFCLDDFLVHIHLETYFWILLDYFDLSPFLS